jgi:hypothetical protein
VARQYTSFFLRCWQLTGGSLRIEIVQISTGCRAVVRSFPLGSEWMEARLREQLLTSTSGPAIDSPK